MYKIKYVIIEVYITMQYHLFIIEHNLGTVVLKSISGASNNGKFRERGGGKYLRTCASIVFSTIGVGTILICYIFCGAILFLTLEGNGQFQ